MVAMRSIEEIKGRCFVDADGHWLWRGSLRADGRANIYAPDHTRGGMSVQFGARAAHHLATGKAIPKGWRVFGCKEHAACVNPACGRCESEVEHGIRQAASGEQRGRINRILANRKINAGRTTVTPALVAEILSSPETGTQIVARTGICRTTVSRIRNGAFSVPPAGVFGGLMTRGRA